MSVSPDTIAQRVARGAEWLDAHEHGWDAKVIVNELDLRYPFDCVCGQIDSDGFYGFAYKHGLTKDSAKRLGFTLNKGEGKLYRQLTAEWKRVIRARRGEE